MTTKIISYEGNFNISGSFNLYSFENIEFQESKDNILKNFKWLFEDKIKNILAKIGLKYVSLSYFSPNAYNYSGDSLTLELRVIDKNKFKRYINKYKSEIQDNLDKNKSYEGYTALTIKDLSEELENLKKPNYSPDLLVLFTILNKLIDFTGFNPYEYVIFEDDKI